MSIEQPQQSKANPRHIVVHFLRHAEALHKVTRMPDKSIRDPRLTIKGKTTCKLFASTTGTQHTGHLTHIFCSPLARAVQTARHCFDDFVKENNHSMIVVWPHLQSFDLGRNGSCLPLEKWNRVFGTGKYAGKIDNRIMETNPSWSSESEDKEAKLGVGYGEWREECIKAQLCDIEAGSEVVLVTHGSLINQLVDTTADMNVELWSYTFDLDRRHFVPERLTEADLERFRAGKDGGHPKTKS